MKRCVHCKEVKSINEFAYSNRLLKTRQKHCRSCMSEFNKASYRKKGKKEKAIIYQNKKRRSNNARQFVWEYLERNPCIGCGESDPRLLEFDHRDPSNKKAPVSVLAMGNHSLDTLKNEIAKCDVLCLNCHRKKTYKERDWFRG